MRVSKSGAVKSAIVAALAACAFATTAAPASAEVVCNRWHECWRVHDHYNYPARFGLVIRNDNWAARHRHGYHWREDRAEHGYYAHGVWHRF